MNYIEAVSYIKNIEVKLGSDYSLKDVTELSERVGRPDRKLNIIHIAGTNGKGSVGNFICSILAASGYQVGRYISPTLIEYRERIQRICGASSHYISEKEVADKLTLLREICEGMVEDGLGQPTAFEIETIMALQMFVEWNVDIAVIETGLGGRLDATNIIEKPLQCVFTSISLEHQAVLGDTIEKIAREKYGIIKEGVQVISVRQENCYPILEEIAEREHATVFYVKDGVEIKKSSVTDGSVFCYQGKEYQIKQLGIYQIENAMIAIEAARNLCKLGFKKIKYDTIWKGLCHSRWQGRFEIVSTEPVILVDGAHNPDAVEKLIQSLTMYFPNEEFDFILGVFADKEYRTEILQLLPYMHQVYTVKAAGQRGLASTALEQCIVEIAEVHGKRVNTIDCVSIKDALSKAISNVDTNRKIIVCGSLSILGEVYQYLHEE